MPNRDCKRLVKLIAGVLLLITGGAKCCEIYSTSPTCDHFHQLERSCDESVDPCEDFYEHACNNWALEHSSTEYNTTAGQADYQMNLKLISVMESLHQRPLLTTNQNVFNKSYIYYRSCVNEKVLNVTRYFEVIKPGLGLEWPLMEELQAHQRGDTDFVPNDWPAGRFNLFALLGKLHSYGLNNMLILQTMQRTSAGLGFTLVGPSVVKKEILSQPVLMTLLSGLGLPEDKALKYAESIENTEKYCHYLYGSFLRSSRTVQLSYKSLKEIYPQIAIFLNIILPQQTPGNEINIVDIYFLDYFLFLMGNEWSAKEAQDICNYFMIKFLIHVLADKAQDLTKLECVKDLRNNLDFPINLLYYEYIYQPQELHYNGDINTLFTKARNYLLEALRENHLNFTTPYLDQWQTQVSAITLNFGNVPRNLRTSRIEKYFRDLPDLELTNYYVNHLHVLRHRLLKSLLVYETQTFSVVTNLRVGSSSTPFYDVHQRMMIIPLGIAQPPIYHYTFDPIFKWSILGFQLAHDFTEAIAFSSLLRSNAEPYLNCIKQQGGIATKYKGVPDLVGAQLAYRAYTNEQDFQQHPEFSKTNWKKLFFLNLAQYFCVSQDLQLREKSAARLKHVITNLESFAEAFQCPVGSNMNPKEKCKFL